MTYTELIIGEFVYDLRHLNPIIVPVTPKEPGTPTLNVRFSFGSHTYTKGWAEGDAPAYKITDGAEERCFCPKRYVQSLHLPRIIHTSSNRRAYFSQGRNFVFVERIAEATGPYCVFFHLNRSKERDISATALVVSAYEKVDFPPLSRLEKITFPTLVFKTARGETVKRP